MPDWKQYVRSQLPPLELTAEREIEIIEELAAQLEQAFADELEAGRDATEAERIAKSQMGDWRLLAQEIETAVPARQQAPPRWWHGVPGDLRHAFRLLRKSPLYTAVAIATLAIGIGGCTAIFSLIEAVILRPTGYREAERLVMVCEMQHGKQDLVALPNFLDWKARNHVFAGMSLIETNVPWNVTSAGALPAVRRGIGVDEDFLTTLGVQPFLGRGFVKEETGLDDPPATILSYSLWMERFHGDRTAIGKTITFDNKPRTVVGVLPADFPWFGSPFDLLMPHGRYYPARKDAYRSFEVVARVKPDATFAQAASEMDAIARQLAAEYPELDKDWGVQLNPLSNRFVGEAGKPLWILMSAVGLVLLIACANVANLMLTRMVVREREMALRSALGATRRRLIRQLMVESAVLALIGCALGCGGAWIAIRLIQAYGPEDVVRLNTAGMGLSVVGFALVVSAVTAIGFGLAPALAAAQLNPAAILKGGMTAARRDGIRGVFVVAQVGLALVLLTGATLLIESIHRLNGVPTGFDPSNVLTGTVMITGVPRTATPALYSRMVEAVRRVPGVENASYISFLPFGGPGMMALPFVEGGLQMVDVEVARPGYFETMHIPLLQGRYFMESDNRADGRRLVVVSEALARAVFGKKDPIGRQLTLRGDSNLEIIGVVADTKDQSLAADGRPAVYFVQGQSPFYYGTIVARTSVKPELLSNAFRAAIQQVKPDQPVTDLRSMEDWIGRSTARLQFQTAVLGVFALIAVVLAVIGVYGVMAYSVEQRTHELGIRLALGASPHSLQVSVAAQGMRLAAVGLALGTVTALASVRVLSSLLYGVSPGDPLTFVSANAVLGLACLLASCLPARRVTQVDPLVALRGV